MHSTKPHICICRSVFAAIAALVMLGSFPARPASLVWTGTTDSNWSTTTNWNPNGTPGTGDTITFNSAGNAHTTISLGGARTISTVLFDTASAAAYTIGSGAIGSETLTLNNAGAITINSTVANNQLFNAALVLGTDTTASTYTFTNNSTTKTLTFAGNISRNGATNTKTIAIAGTGNTVIGGVVSGTALALTKSGTGTLTLSGTNTFTGALTISAGIVSVPVVNNASAAGPLGNSATAVTLDGTLAYTGASASSTKKFVSSGTFQIDSAATELTLSGVISGLALDKSGPGTLTLTAANTYTSYTSISAGTLKLSGSGTLGASGTDLYMSGGGTVLDLNGKSVTVGDFSGSAGSMIVNNSGGGVSLLTANTTFANNASFGGIIADNNNGTAGTVAFTKGGTLPLTLTGANTYSGATIVSGYSLTLAGNGTLGNTVGATTVNSGATLRLAVTSCAEAITISGAGFQAGEGALEGYNTTYTGLLALGAAATVCTFAYPDTFAITNPGTILGPGRTLTLSGFSGSKGSIASIIGTTTGGVTVTDGTLWTLTGTNTFSGIVTVNGGSTLVIPTINNAGAAGPLGSSSATTAVTLTTGTLEYTGGTASSTKPFTLNTNGTIQIDSAATELTLSGVISGVGDALIKTGAGTLTLTAANTYSGGTTINFPGTLKLSGSGRLGATTGGLFMQNGKLDLGGTDQTVGSLMGFGTIVNNGGGTSVLTVNTSATDNVYNNFIFDNDNGTSGTVGLTKSGTGTLTLGLGGTSNYSGAVQVTNGILVANSFDALGSATGATIVSSGATLRIQSVGVIAAEPIEISGVGETGTDGALEGTASTYGGLLKLNAASTIAAINTFPEFTFDITNPGTITGATFTLTLAGTGAGSIASIIGTTSGGLIKNDSGTWTLTGANTYTGATTINAGILNVQNDTAFGTTAGGVSVISGATVQIEGDITIGAEAMTIRGTGAAGATGALENVSGTNTYGGLLTLGANSTISSDAGTLSLTNTGIINDLFDLTLTGAGDGSLASVLATGANTVTKTGTGKWTLSGANTFTSTLSVLNGTLAVPTFNNASAAGPLGQSALAVTLGAASASGTIEYTGTSATSSKPFALAANGVGVFQIDSAGTELTLTGAITGSGNLEKAGLGTLTFASSKAFTGATLVTEGMLKLTVASAISGSSGITVDSGGVLLLAGTPASDRITNTIPLTLSGGTLSTEGLSNASETLGTFNLTGANSTIDFGSGSGDWLTFSGVGTHTAGIKLAIVNWSGTPNQLGGASSDRVIFLGASTTAFTSLYTQADVSFNGTSGYLAIQYDASHYEIVAVPEPSSVVLSAVTALGLISLRRRPLAAK